MARRELTKREENTVIALRQIARLIEPIKNKMVAEGREEDWTPLFEASDACRQAVDHIQDDEWPEPPCVTAHKEQWAREEAALQEAQT